MIIQKRSHQVVHTGIIWSLVRAILITAEEFALIPMSGLAVYNRATYVKGRGYVVTSDLCKRNCCWGCSKEKEIALKISSILSGTDEQLAKSYKSVTPYWFIVDKEVFSYYK